MTRRRASHAATGVFRSRGRSRRFQTIDLGGRSGPVGARLRANLCTAGVTKGWVRPRLRLADEIGRAAANAHAAAQVWAQLFDLSL